MSEETRRLHAAAIAEVKAKVELLYNEIAGLESCVEELQNSVPPELPEDYAWRLEQMSPTERTLHQITNQHLTEVCKRLVKDFERYTTNDIFTQATAQGKPTYLRIRLPNGDVIATPKDPT